MKRKLLILCASLFVFAVQAQNVYNSSGRSTAHKPQKKTGFNIDKLVVGGDFRLSGGNGISVGIAPMAGYQLVKNFFVGARIGYNYDRLKVDPASLPSSATTNVFNYNSFSGGLWARYLIFQSFYIHVEAAYVSYQNYYEDGYGTIFKKYVQAPSVLAGVGFKQPVSDRVSINTTILYDILQDPNSYYINRGGGIDYRFGVLVGF